MCSLNTASAALLNTAFSIAPLLLLVKNSRPSCAMCDTVFFKSPHSILGNLMVPSNKYIGLLCSLYLSISHSVIWHKETRNPFCMSAR